MLANTQKGVFVFAIKLAFMTSTSFYQIFVIQFGIYYKLNESENYGSREFPINVQTSRVFLIASVINVRAGARNKVTHFNVSNCHKTRETCVIDLPCNRSKTGNITQDIYKDVKVTEM